MKRIGRHLGCSHHTVKRYVAAGGAVAFKTPERAKKLDGHEDWLRERFQRHRGNADVVRALDNLGGHVPIDPHSAKRDAAIAAVIDEATLAMIAPAIAVGTRVGDMQLASAVATAQQTGKQCLPGAAHRGSSGFCHWRCPRSG